ncbi:hypothetical protein HDE_04425 [Halotydeus destructor]|nr:hypothetical protein HDE_04425 [Halotydeus destructor]
METLLRLQNVRHVYCTAHLGDTQIQQYEQCYANNSVEYDLRIHCERLAIEKDGDRRDFYCNRQTLDRNTTFRLVDCLHEERKINNCSESCALASPYSNKTVDMIGCQEAVLESISAIDRKSQETFFEEMAAKLESITAIDTKFCNQSAIWSEETLEKATTCHWYSGLLDHGQETKCLTAIWRTVIGIASSGQDESKKVDARKLLICLPDVQSLVSHSVVKCIVRQTRGPYPEGLFMATKRPLWRTDHSVRFHPFDFYEDLVQKNTRRTTCLEKAMAITPSVVIKITD